MGESQKRSWFQTPDIITDRAQDVLSYSQVVETNKCKKPSSCRGGGG